jgi:hypothetical protein
MRADAWSPHRSSPRRPSDGSDATGGSPRRPGGGKSLLACVHWVAVPQALRARRVNRRRRRRRRRGARAAAQLAAAGRGGGARGQRAGARCAGAGPPAKAAGHPAAGALRQVCLPACLPACLPVCGWVGVVDGGHPACQPVRAGRCRAWFPAERLASLSLLRVRVEIMGPGKSEIVGKSQSVLRGGRSQAPRGWRLTRARSRPSRRRRRRPAPGLLGVWAALTPQPSSQRSKRRRGGWGMRTGVPTTVR